MRIHLGCGPVYLDGYINVDAHGPENHYLASERKDILEQNKTTVCKYYKNKVTRKDIESCSLHRQDVVVDLYCNDFSRLPFFENSVDEIRLVQVFEHFTYAEGERLLQYWFGLLKPGGVLHLDVPDLYETAKLYTQAVHIDDKKWYARLLFGSQKNEYGLHRSMYDRQMLSYALNKIGFSKIEYLPNIHFYPAFAVEAIK